MYSWRRAVDPATAAPYAYLFHYIANGEAIVAGRRPPETLAVRALDEFSLEFDSKRPFLSCCGSSRAILLRHASTRNRIGAAPRRGKLLDPPENIVTSGAFTLRERRPYERIVLARSAAYYDADAVSLEQILFLPVTDGSTSANLYRAGEAALQHADVSASDGWVCAVRRTFAHIGTSERIFL